MKTEPTKTVELMKTVLVHLRSQKSLSLLPYQQSHQWQSPSPSPMTQQMEYR
jgi:hypothetical protein